MRDPDRSEVVVAGEQVVAEQLAAMLRGVLGEIDAGRLNASAVFRARIEGAVVALDVVLGADAATVLDRLAGTPNTRG
jgi:hypothetical protein